MLTCIYHPIYPMRVVEDDVAEELRASGLWFDCPAKAKAYRSNIEDDIKNEVPQREHLKSKRKGK
jgi:hypothetical protein